MGGFECSTHRRGDDSRIDVVESSQHDKFAFADYKRLAEIGMLTARDGVRWHLIERAPYEYDFSSAMAQVRAARKCGLQIIWDLFHYGFPADLDLMSDEFVNRFAAFAAAFTKLLRAEGDSQPYFCLVNEISFFAWIAGDVGWWYPFFRGRGNDVKRQLVKATIAAAEKVREIAPQAVLVQADPSINVVDLSGDPQNRFHAQNVHNSQYQSLDMLLGIIEPELGGYYEMIDVVGVNYYPQNQWEHPSGQHLHLGDKDYKPFRRILQDYYARYKKPLFIAETGIEDEARPEWFRYICQEVYAAVQSGVPIYGICLYPILNHPGWDDNRHCHNGLWDYADEHGERLIYKPLADEIEIQAEFFGRSLAKSADQNF